MNLTIAEYTPEYWCNRSVEILAQDLMDQVYVRNTIFLFSVLVMGIVLFLDTFFPEFIPKWKYFDLFWSGLKGFLVVYCVMWSISFLIV